MVHELRAGARAAWAHGHLGHATNSASVRILSILSELSSRKLSVLSELSARELSILSKLSARKLSILSILSVLPKLSELPVLSVWVGECCGKWIVVVSRTEGGVVGCIHV